ncbi:hypothetical protein SAMN05421578_1302 [Paenibacillus macquariensis]|uniref:Transposase n=1 Tax=Paenibacillus macquariensis TaxID=948756 RepID=A0ABY1KH42_9BACL|nr:hypothetical protein SAMN05421578_1302 [Paenibacillus macquariensis]
MIKLRRLAARTLPEDIVQRIFVMNQLIKIYERSRESKIKWCSDLYFKIL